MTSEVKIKQHDITDCGAACLASIAAFHKLKLPIARIRQFAGTDKKGTNVLGMVEAAVKLGFQAKGVKGTLESLSKIPKPAIAHIIVKEVLHHYVVIYDVSKTHITVMDPADGRMHKRNIEDFLKEWTGVLILLLPDESFKKGNEKISVLQRFWFLLLPHRSVMIQALIGAAVYTVLGLATSIYIQKITDSVLVGGNTNLLNLLSITMILILLLQVFLGTAKSMFALRTGQQIDARLILGYYKHLLKLPQQFFDTMRVGEIISRVNDAVKIRAFINNTALDLVVNLFIVVFSFCLMFTYYWKLALIMLAIIPLYATVYWIANHLNRKQQRQLMEKGADLETQLVESLNNVSTIKRFGVENYANLKTETRFVNLLQSVFKSGSTAIGIGNANELISRLFTIILLWCGSYFVIDRQLTPGELLSFYALIGYFTGPASSLITANRTIQEALIAADRLFEIMDLEREEDENKLDFSRDMVGDIVFKEVAFRYGTRTQVFEKLDLKIQRGKITAVVGESGSGKTTLLSLLQNLYPIQSGNITIGDFNIKYIRNENLRKIVSVVPQQIDLFAGSIIENIALGILEPDMKKVLEICRQLGIIDFVEKMPNGFLTQVGENGVGLSGGQKQRLAIARALYREPEVLILDEATSSLDSLSEQYVLNTIEDLRKQGKTILIIAHRLSTIKKADRIIVLENGNVVEEGNHQELLWNKQQYSRLWEKQFEEIV